MKLKLTNDELKKLQDIYAEKHQKCLDSAMIFGEFDKKTKDLELEARYLKIIIEENQAGMAR